MRPLFFLESSSVFLALISLLKTEVVVLVLPFRQLLSHVLHVLLEYDLQQDCLHHLVDVVRLGRIGGLRFGVDETVGVVIATMVNNFPRISSITSSQVLCQRFRLGLAGPTTILFPGG